MENGSEGGRLEAGGENPTYSFIQEIVSELLLYVRHYFKCRAQFGIVETERRGGLRDVWEVTWETNERASRGDSQTIPRPPDSDGGIIR